MLLAVIRANNFQNDHKLFCVRLRRALVLALTDAGVTDIVWERIGRDEVLQAFPRLGPSFPRFHFSAVPYPCTARTLVIEESEMFFEPAVFELLMNWPGETSIEATHHGKPLGLWARSLSKRSREISVEIPEDQLFFAGNRVGRSER